MTPEEYKIAQIERISNLKGGSIWEINVVSATLLTSYLFYTVNARFISTKPTFFAFLYETTILNLPILCTMTIAANNVYTVHILLGILTLFALIFQPPSSIGTKQAKSSNPKDPKTQDASTTTFTAYSHRPTASHLQFLSSYRATMMIMTCIAILAVDFPIFPLRFAKAENFGTSLMDVGVGAFVFSSGLISYRFYATEYAFTSFGMRFIGACRTAFPLLALGLIRFFLTKGVDYHQHTSEYGLHWNFFITLGLLPPFTTVILGILQAVLKLLRLGNELTPNGLLGLDVIGIMWGLFYQSLLSNPKTEKFLLYGARTDLISANKEGIYSFNGYLAIFFLGLHTGSILLADPSRRNKRKAVSLATYIILYWGGLHVSLALFNTEVSRQMANFPYILWVSAFNTTFVAFFWAIEVFVRSLSPGDKPDKSSKSGTELSEDEIMSRRLVPWLFESINMNGLLVFLVANLLTGLVNLNMRTLFVPDDQAFFVCWAYITTVCAFAWVVWAKLKIRIKL